MKEPTNIFQRIFANICTFYVYPSKRCMTFVPNIWCREI